VNSRKSLISMIISDNSGLFYEPLPPVWSHSVKPSQTKPLKDLLASFSDEGAGRV